MSDKKYNSYWEWAYDHIDEAMPMPPKSALESFVATPIEPLYPGKLAIIDELHDEYTINFGAFDLAPIYKSILVDKSITEYFVEQAGLRPKTSWRKFWRYEETREFSESLVKEGAICYRGFLQAFSYHDYDRDCTIYYPFGINWLVAWARKIKYETMWSVLDIDKREKKSYLAGWLAAQENMGKQYLAGFKDGEYHGKYKSKESVIDDKLKQYVFDVIRNQRHESKMGL